MPHDVPLITVALIAKPWWKSRTVWFNAVLLGLAAAESRLSLLQALLPVNVYSLLSFVLPVGNVMLRFITQQAVSFGGVPPVVVGTPSVESTESSAVDSAEERPAS